MGKDAASTASGGSAVSAMTKATSMAPPSTVKVEKGVRKENPSTVMVQRPPGQPKKGPVATLSVCQSEILVSERFQSNLS